MIRTAIVAVIDADYRADLAGLRRGARTLSGLARSAAQPTAAYYWSGYADWRFAINAANEDPPDRAAIRAALATASAAYQEALAADPGHVESQIALIGVIGMQLFFTPQDDPAFRTLMDAGARISKALPPSAKQNPRLLWLRGGTEFFAPPPVGRGAEAAMNTYFRGIANAISTPAPADVAEPSWGLPELLMSAAYVSARLEDPDWDAAERYAQAALRLRGDWHYVKEVLLPDIRSKKLREIPSGSE
ncbi:MAG: hypothetical protein JNN30_08095 [Rhodanobacteraceae bacterium]|nr:hypothetical protein [Rhodanobacteraceae bacterium]